MFVVRVDGLQSRRRTAIAIGCIVTAGGRRCSRFRERFGIRMAETIVQPTHGVLPCGAECAVVPLPNRHVVSFQIRVLAGVCAEPAEKLGLSRMLSETIDKGTELRSGQQLSDAFDAIGASRSAAAGRETSTFACTVLPEHFDEAMKLHAELLRKPTFPADSFEANMQLTRQELLALEDDAHGLTDKLISRRAFGPVVGRHALGEPDTIESIVREDLCHFWQTRFCAGGMLVTIAGAIEPKRAADVVQEAFDGFGSASAAGRQPYSTEFSPGIEHFHKKLEQQQIAICFPGVDVTHADFPTQQVMLGILSGGMSGRLFTEVREKQGLVYWVSAWQDTPRGTGMIFLGASTTPQRCDKTYTTLLREVDRLTEDIEDDELERAKTGITAQYDTRGDTTRARCVELANDLFFFRRPIPVEEKVGWINAVTAEEIVGYLETHPRHPRCVVTLGPRPLEFAEVNRSVVVAGPP
jgi:predicted Zn-dependent peptidase